METDLKVSCVTLGCKVNQYDSSSMLEHLRDQGYTIAAEGEQAEIYIINTCAVTNESERKSRQLIRKIKNKNPDSIVVVSGCYPQTNLDAVKNLIEADIIIGTHNRSSLPSLIQTYLKQRSRIIDISSDAQQEKLTTDFTDKTRASIKIQDGCNMFCTYCIIPYARDEIKSVPSALVIQNINELIKAGYQEVTLTGIHLASYLDDNGMRLIDLIERIDQGTELKRLRLGSLEPRLLSDKFLSRLSECKCFCEHFHISLQSGNDDILKAMNRRYDVSEFRQTALRVRSVFPKAQITTDIIVGFPGETEEMFLDTLNFTEEIRFADIHVFPFSPKKGTPAAEMDGQLSNHIKHERANRLIEASQKIREEILKEQVGTEVSVLFERMHDRDLYDGYTETYLPVRYQSAVDQTNRIVRVVILGVEDGILHA